MLTLILSLAYAAVVVKAIAVYRINRMYGMQFRAVCAALLFSLIRTAVIVSLPFYPRQAVYSATAPLELVISAWAIFEVFQRVTENHFKTNLWGSRFLVGIAFISALISLLVRGAWMDPTWHGLQWVMATEFLSVFGMVVFLSLTCLILQLTRRIPESPVATRATAILLFHGVCSMAIAGLSASTGMRSWWTVSVAPAANGLVAGLLWATVFVRGAQHVDAEEHVSRDEHQNLSSSEAGLVADLHGRDRWLRATE